VHAQDIKAPTAKHVDLIELITSAVSPVSMNNPSYTTMEIATSPEPKVTSVTWRALQLYSYLLSRKINFETINPQRQFSVDFNDVETVRGLEERLGEDLNEFIKYAVAIMGYSWVVQKAAEWLLPLFFSLENL